MIVANKPDLVLSRGISFNLSENQVEQHVSEAMRELEKEPMIVCSHKPMILAISLLLLVDWSLRELD